MTNRTFMMAATTIAALAALAGTARAAGPAGLEVKSQGDIRYVSGGIGDEEQKALKAMAKDFNLEVTVAVSAGNYLGDVDLVLVKAESKEAVLTTRTEGPIFLAQVPKGRYEIRATANGKTETKTVDVGTDQRASAMFHLGQLEKPEPVQGK